jgi:hypothetical protein
MLDGFALPFAYRFPSFHTIPKIAMAAIGGTTKKIPVYRRGEL